jgi:hypothetical protein
VAQFGAACIARYGNEVFAIAGHSTCYTCPPYYTHTGPGTLTCTVVKYRPATRTGAATGLLKTDCPRGTFWDPNGNCYTCPTNYNRTVASVTDRQACGLSLRLYSEEELSIISVGPP